MKVYVANFGKSNWAWPDCLNRGTIAIMDDERVHSFWLNNDRDGYIQRAREIFRSKNGSPLTIPVASRWFNCNTVLRDTVGDLWIHRDKNVLWWTQSLAGDPDITVIGDPFPLAGPSKIYVYHKRCSGWSSRDKKGAPIRWDVLPARAQKFLVTTGTFCALSSDNASYANALVEGLDVSRWHSPLESHARGVVAGDFGSRAKTISRMASTAWETAFQSGGFSQSLKKEKEYLFCDLNELESYIGYLIDRQEFKCALTGLGMVFDGDGDPELRCSLDRIDSDGHYERGNLQVVCCFANRWKGASDNAEFRRLVELIKLV